jgi:hypothetical protein
MDAIIDAYLKGVLAEQEATMNEVATRAMTGNCATLTRVVIDPVTGEEKVAIEIVDISDIA